MLSKLIAECSDYDFKVQVERQRPKSWLKSVSAFANNMGGSLFFGVDNDRKIVGIENPQEVCDFISEKINSKIKPTPKYELIPQNENGKVVVIVKVYPGTSTPYYYESDGIREAYIRSGNESVVAPVHILNELILKGTNQTYDSLVTRYRKSDYSFTLFEATFLEKTYTKITEQDYISFGLATNEGYLTNAGVLLADQNIYRQNRIFCTHWIGLDKTSINKAIDDKEISGGVIGQLFSALDFVRNNTKKNWHIEGLDRIVNPDYDEEAIREAIVNAIIHREYTQLGSEVSINLFDDRLEITSPGGMYSGQEIKQQMTDVVTSARRNPILADLFARMNFMERRGTGLKKITDRTNRLFGDKDNHVEFYCSGGFFRVVIYNSNYNKQLVIPLDGIDPVEHIIDNVPLNGTVNVPLNGTVKTVYEWIKKKNSYTAEDLKKLSGKSDRTVKRAIKTLKDNGFIERCGADKNGYWKILK